MTDAWDKCEQGMAVQEREENELYICLATIYPWFKIVFLKDFKNVLKYKQFE